MKNILILAFSLLPTLSLLPACDAEPTAPGAPTQELVLAPPAGADAAELGEVTPRNYGPTSAWVMTEWDGAKMYTAEFAEMVLAPIAKRDPQWSSCTLSYYAVDETSDREWVVGLGCATLIGGDYIKFMLEHFQQNGAVQVLP